MVKVAGVALAMTLIVVAVWGLVNTAMYGWRLTLSDNSPWKRWEWQLALALTSITIMVGAALNITGYVDGSHPGLAIVLIIAASIVPFVLAFLLGCISTILRPFFRSLVPLKVLFFSGLPVFWKQTLARLKPKPKPAAE